MSSDFLSDESTLVNDAHRLPADNYLWTSPEGLVLTGRHHQLILHLLAIEPSWEDDFSFNFEVIEKWLRDVWPTYAVHPEVLFAIANEYLHMNELEQHRFKATTAFPVPEDVGQSQQIVPSVEVDMVEAGIVPRPETLAQRSSSELLSLPMEAQGSVDDPVLTPPPLTPDGLQVELSAQTSVPMENEQSVIQHRALADHCTNQNIRITEENAGQYAIIYLAALTNRTPQDLLENVSREASDPIPSEHSSVGSTRSGNNTPETITTAETEIVEQQQSTLPDGQTSTFNPSTGYSKPVRRTTIIAVEEAEAFLRSFDPAVNSIPARIEGYFWYCDKCYAPGSGVMRCRGRFASRSVVEKHMNEQHGTPGQYWTCSTLPEKARDLP